MRQHSQLTIPHSLDLPLPAAARCCCSLLPAAAACHSASFTFPSPVRLLACLPLPRVPLAVLCLSSCHHCLCTYLSCHCCHDHGCSSQWMTPSHSRWMTPSPTMLPLQLLPPLSRPLCLPRLLRSPLPPLPPLSLLPLSWPQSSLRSLLPPLPALPLSRLQLSVRHAPD